MKRSIVILFLAIIAFSAYGQTKEDTVPKKKFSAVGLYIGINNTYGTKAGVYSNTNVYGLSPLIGAYGIFELNYKWDFETGLGFMEYDAKYLRYGYSYDLGTKPDTIDFADHLMTTAYYVTVPFILKYKLTPRSSILGGIRASGEATDNQASIKGYLPGKIYDDYPDRGLANYMHKNQFDIGLILGYEFNFSDRLFVSFMGNIGFIPLFPKSFTTTKAYDATTGESDYFYPAATGNYNNSLSIRICYSFLTWGEDRFELPYHRGCWRRPLSFPSK